MAYNYMFPANYQPQQSYYPTQSGSGITWVQGEAGAKSYLVAPNSTVQLWDSESQTIYLKSADASGMPSMKVLDYTIREEARPETLSASQSDFATKDDILDIRKDIDAINERIASLTKKGAKKDE